MPKKPDPNQTAARIVREATSDHEMPLPGDVDEAWTEWSRGIANVDARTMTLLRAAFLAGVDVGKQVSGK